MSHTNIEDIMNAHRGLINYKARASVIETGGDTSPIDLAINVFERIIGTHV